MTNARVPRVGRQSGPAVRVFHCWHSNCFALGCTQLQASSTKGYKGFVSICKMETGETGENANISPKWLDQTFVAELLHRENGIPVNVHQLRVKRAVPIGENYGSFILRVGVDYTVKDEVSEPSTHKTSLIVKTLPLAMETERFHRESRTFERETKMYTTTLPALEAILEGIEGEKISFGPKIYPVDREHTIVLQDLCQFRMRDRRMGLDLAHATLVLRNLARLHAASVELHARDPEQIENYREVFFVAEKRQQIQTFIPNSLEEVAKMVEYWEKEDPQKYAGYADRLRAFTLTAVDRICEDMEPSKTFLNVLNHGDCFINNVLFRYAEDNGELQEMRFIDFQMSRYVSPTLDLQHQLFTSVQTDVREEHWDLLLGAYISQLRETLEALGHAEEAEKITQESIEKEMKERGAFGLTTSCCILRCVMADPVDAKIADNMEKLEKEDVGILEKVTREKRFNDALKRLLPMFVANGIL